MTHIDLGDLVEALFRFLISPLGLMILLAVFGRVAIDRLFPRRRRRRARRSGPSQVEQVPVNGAFADKMIDVSPEAFEHFVADLFRRRGYRAHVVGRDGDHGIDIVVTNREGERELVQCKQWKNKWIGEGVVWDFYGAFVHDGHAVRGYIVTTSFFSNAARAWAKGKPIDLIDGKRLAKAVETLG